MSDLPDEPREWLEGFGITEDEGVSDDRLTFQEVTLRLQEVLRERDEAREELRQRVHAHDGALIEWRKAQAQRDRYEAALREVAATNIPRYDTDDCHAHADQAEERILYLRDIAREALAGTEEGNE